MHAGIDVELRRSCSLRVHTRCNVLQHNAFAGQNCQIDTLPDAERERVAAGAVLRVGLGSPVVASRSHEAPGTTTGMVASRGPPHRNRVIVARLKKRRNPQLQPGELIVGAPSCMTVYGNLCWQLDAV